MDDDTEMRAHARTAVARLVRGARSLAFDASARVSPEAVAGAVAELRERGVEVVDSALYLIHAMHETLADTR